MDNENCKDMNKICISLPFNIYNANALIRLNYSQRTITVFHTDRSRLKSNNFNLTFKCLTLCMNVGTINNYGQFAGFGVSRQDCRTNFTD